MTCTMDHSLWFLDIHNIFNIPTAGTSFQLKLKNSRFCSALERKLSSARIRVARKGHRVVYRLTRNFSNPTFLLFYFKNYWSIIFIKKFLAFYFGNVFVLNRLVSVEVSQTEFWGPQTDAAKSLPLQNQGNAKEAFFSYWPTLTCFTSQKYEQFRKSFTW